MSTLETAERVLGIADAAARTEQSLEDALDAAGVPGSLMSEGERPAWDAHEEDEVCLLSREESFRHTSPGDEIDVSPGFFKSRSR